nr:sigma-70 family RNA polymerase sigma factor [Desulfitobacterium hafniense]
MRDPDKVKSWVLKITANLCKDQFRTQARQNHLDTSENLLVQIPGPQDTSQEVIRREQDRLLMEAVLALDVILRETVMLYFYEELNTKEIASILNISPITVRVRLYRARKILKRWLEKRGLYNEIIR